MPAPSTFSELQTTLLGYLQSSGALVDPVECIGMAESRLSRLLNTPDMEVLTTLDASTATVDLPDDFYEVRNVYLNVSPRLRLEPTSLSALQDFWASNRAGKPMAYAISAGSLMIAPGPDAAYSVVLTYKAALQPLSDANPTNWLLAKHPDLYVAAALTMAEFRGWNDSRLPLLKSWYDELLSEVNKSGQKARYGNGPLRMRSTVSDSFSIATAGAGQASDSDQFLVDG